MTPTPLDYSNRHSLEPACGLPSPLSSPGRKSHYDTPDTAAQDDSFTLISCMSHLSVCSLPPPPPPYAFNGNQGQPSGDVKGRFPDPPKPRESSVLGSRSEQRRIYLGPKLSDRATGGPDAGPLIERFSCLFKDQYNCKSNPRGIVSLYFSSLGSTTVVRTDRDRGVAENFLMESECIEWFGKAIRENYTRNDLSYGDSLWGSRRINRALSGFYNEYFNPAEEVLPEQIITGVGCSAVLDQLFYTLMDEGEAILLAAPYYSGFDRDLVPRSRIRLVPVDVGQGDDAFSPDSMAAFERAYKELEDQGIRTRAVIVCNPQNPLGRAYSRETLLAYARFCEEKDLHLVSDEIYAMSTYSHDDFPDASPFTSMMSLDVEKELGITFDRARLHIVYGMSKDFCANGLRIGSLVSQHNPLLLRAMASTSMLMKISSPADVIWSSLLNDKDALQRFIQTNQSRLTEAHAFIRKWFSDRGIHVAKSNAGHFIWVDIGGYMGFRDVATEKKVFQRLLDGGVYIAPGNAYHSTIAGWFRVTFSVARDDLLVGLGKIEQLLDLHTI